METHILPLRLLLTLSWFISPFDINGKGLFPMKKYLPLSSCNRMPLSPWDATPFTNCHNWLHVSVCITQKIYLFEKTMSHSAILSMTLFATPLNKNLENFPIVLIIELTMSSHLPSTNLLLRLTILNTQGTRSLKLDCSKWYMNVCYCRIIIPSLNIFFSICRFIMVLCVFPISESMTSGIYSFTCSSYFYFIVQTFLILKLVFSLMEYFIVLLQSQAICP